MPAVTPLTAADGRRVALNFAYDRSRQQAYGHSATALYDDPPTGREMPNAGWCRRRP